MTFQTRNEIEAKFMAEHDDPFALQELRRLFRPRVNRRVITSVIVPTGFDKRPGFENSNLIGFAEFYQDGYSAMGTVSRSEAGNIIVRYNTAWTNMRPIYAQKMENDRFAASLDHNESA